MKSLINLVGSLVIAIWAIAAAILSVQNFNSVSLRFLGFTSIQIPGGLVLVFSAGAGMVAGAIALPFFIPSQRQTATSPSYTRYEYEDDDDREEDLNKNQQVGADDWLKKPSEDW